MPHRDRQNAKRIAETASQHRLTNMPSSPAAVSNANGVPNLSGLDSGSHETHPQIPGKHTDDPTITAPTEAAKTIAGRFIAPHFKYISSDYSAARASAWLGKRPAYLVMPNMVNTLTKCAERPKA
jgi:hypothetical protein